ncbi:sensor domain-containing phosphodiesterase [Alkalicoccus urumqiensis]|nr:EAL domain-containing protein [Alkalicoccus urumqiensis]
MKHVGQNRSELELYRLLQKIHDAVTLKQGDAFFEELARSIADVLQRSYAFIGRFQGNGQMETVACIADGVRIDNFSYQLRHTPCERVTADKAMCTYPSRAASLFPKDEDLVDWNVESYAGSPLLNSDEEVIGILVVMDKKPIDDPALVEAVLGIFSRQAASRLEQLEQTAELQHRESAYRELVERLPDALVLMENRMITYCNQSALSLFLLDRPENVEGRELGTLLELENESFFEDTLLDVEKTGLASSIFSTKAHRGDGRMFYLEISVLPYSSGSTAGMQLIIRDETYRKETADSIEYMAFHDTVTGIPNRRFLEAHAESVLHSSDNASLLFIDINRFKRINAGFGQQTGDALLRQIAEKLKHHSSSGGMAVRWSGAEFVVLLPGKSGREEALTLLETLRKPFFVSGIELIVSFTIGISHSPIHGMTLEDLISRADQAMAYGKGSSEQITTYESFMDQHSYDTLLLENGLQTALQRNELELYYQPLYNSSTGALSGTEALLRWNHPDFGLVSPADFIPIAEMTGLIVPIGEWVLKQACQDIQELHEAGFPEATVSVNLSVRQLYQQNLVETVCAVLRETGLPPEKLKLEITESMAADLESSSMEKIRRLQQMGVHFWIDDFGTGYSSLSYLSTMAFDGLKIDRSFIQRLLERTPDATIVRSTITLAHDLGMHVTAEGIELERERLLLTAWGCDELQGYLLARPQPLCELKKLVAPASFE